MPAQAKSPRSAKKTIGPAKTKGAVRAKSGCYTCRIRRKKCDERKMGDDGPCETCFRLKLECLGFGAKRPDWLRESSKVSAIREQIKTHLASQGMIKGHSGSGSRNAVHQDTLRLSEYKDVDVLPHSGSASDSSESPPRGNSVEPDRTYYQEYNNLMPARALSSYGAFEEMVPYRSPHPSHHNPYIHLPYHHEHPMDVPPSRCFSPSDTSSPNYAPGSVLDFPLQIHPMTSETPATRSNLSPSYNLRETFFAENLIQFSIGDPNMNTPDLAPTPPISSSPPNIIDQNTVNAAIENDVRKVVKIQYLLGDDEMLPRIVIESFGRHPLSREAITLLTQAYQRRQHDRVSGQVIRDPKFREVLRRVQDGITAKIRPITRDDDMDVDFDSPPVQAMDEDDAMAALQCVSVHLFDGGKGGWLSFLNLAAQYARQCLMDLARAAAPNEFALSGASDQSKFVIKTTIWFDVIGSMTTQKAPILIDAIRYLFDPLRRYPNYSMLDPMGCSNDVLWAMAEATALAAWKKARADEGDLSTIDLVARGKTILKFLYPPCMQPVPERQSPVDTARRFSSEMFRAAARLFVHSIIAGDYPRVREIRQAVEELITIIRDLPYTELRPRIVRSTVFPLFICGALTDRREHKDILIRLLEQRNWEEPVGNVSSILETLQRLWKEEKEKENERERSGKKRPKEPVQWRQALQKHLLLLV